MIQQTHTRTVEIDRDADYWRVSMGRRDHINGPASYPFPSLDAATGFAQAHKARDPYRKIHIEYPDGRRVEVCLNSHATGSEPLGSPSSKSPSGSSLSKLSA